MTQSSNPFGDCAMDELTWSQMARYFSLTGIQAVPWLDEVNELQVTTTGGANRAISVDTGSAGIQGFYYLNDAPLTLNPDANSSPAGTRADLIVLECKYGSSAGITAKIIPGTAGVSWPAGYGSRTGLPRPPDPVRDPFTLWQVPLAQVNVANGATVINTSDITDMRQFVNAGTAKSDTYVIAAAGASPLIRANADAVIPSGYAYAEDIINYGIAEVATKYGGGTVKLTEGRFDTTLSINCLSQVNVRGLGWGTKIYQQPTGTYVPIFMLNNADWVAITDLYMNGGGSPLSRGALPASPSSNLAGVEIYDSSVNTLRNLYIDACRNCGVWINTIGMSSWGHRVEGCYITGSYHEGVYTTGQQGIYTNNQLRSNAMGITLAGASGSVGASGNIVSNNHIAGNWMNGLQINSWAYSAYRNHVNSNVFLSNGINANNVYAHIFLLGAGCYNNFITGNQLYTDSTSAAYKPQWGIYLDTTVFGNNVTNNECGNSAYTAANNIKCTRAASSNITPNKIRYNQSGSVAPDGSSYDG
jgi:hypothetical protein